MNHHAKLERVGLFLDHAGTRAALRQAGRQVALPRLRNYLGEGRQVLTTFLYLEVPPQAEAEALAHAQALRQEGVIVRTTPAQLGADGESYADVRVPMTLDVLDFIQRAHPDIVVIAHSGQGMESLLERLRLAVVRS